MSDLVQSISEDTLMCARRQKLQSNVKLIVNGNNYESLINGSLDHTTLLRNLITIIGSVSIITVR